MILERRMSAWGQWIICYEALYAMLATEVHSLQFLSVD